MECTSLVRFDINTEVLVQRINSLGTYYILVSSSPTPTHPIGKEKNGVKLLHSVCPRTFGSMRWGLFVFFSRGMTNLKCSDFGLYGKKPGLFKNIENPNDMSIMGLYYNLLVHFQLRKRTIRLKKTGTLTN
jgi:hypothetical protein